MYFYSLSKQSFCNNNHSRKLTLVSTFGNGNSVYSDFSVYLNQTVSPILSRLFSLSRVAGR